MAFISVIIPLYNKEMFICDTISSVLSQTFKDFELIVIDDGSSDTSIKKLDEFNDKRLRILQQQNKGVSVARNTGILNSKANWIAFLDADDWWENTYLEELVSLIKTFPDEKIFATGRSRIFKTQKDRYNNSYLPAKNQVGFVDYYEVITKYFPPINSSSVLIKKEILIKEDGPFKPNQKQHEDHDLWLRLTKDRLIVFSNKNLSFYRKELRNTASTRYYTPEDFIKYLDTIEKLKGELKGNQKQNFAKYYNKFILLTILKYQTCYTKQESHKVYEISKKIVSIKYRFLLSILQIIPSKNIYVICKKLKEQFGRFKLIN
jgi:glycosyltransferase involved in cell wall biosynthesis